MRKLLLGCAAVPLVLFAWMTWIYVSYRSDLSNRPTATATRITRTVEAMPTATPLSSPTSALTATRTPQTLLVGNTGGDGVSLRRSPSMADRLRSWPDGTPMVVVGPDQLGEGRVFKNVRDPAGNVGFVPANFLIEVPGAPPGPGATATPTPRPLG